MVIVKEHMTLETTEDGKKFSKNFSKLRKKNTIRAKVDKELANSEESSERGSVYVGHIPHGFYEEQLNSYFKQFGQVSAVHLCRSEKTGKSKGYAFVEFEDSRVAKIAAQTMNNYLMCNRRIIAAFVPSDGKSNQRRHQNFAVNEKNYPLKLIRDKVNSQKNLNVSDAQHNNKCKRYVTTIKNTLLKLKELGIDYDFKPVEDPKNFYALYDPYGKAKVEKALGKQKLVTKVKKSLNSKVNAIVKKKNTIKRKQ